MTAPQKLWDLDTGREIGKLEVPSSWVYSVAFSPDGKTALTGGGGDEEIDDDFFLHNELKLWDLATGRGIRELKGHLKEIKSVAFSPDGKTALSGESRPHHKALGSRHRPRDPQA